MARSTTGISVLEAIVMFGVNAVLIVMFAVVLMRMQSSLDGVKPRWTKNIIETRIVGPGVERTFPTHQNGDGAARVEKPVVMNADLAVSSTSGL